jgi:hypothetical protein
MGNRFLAGALALALAACAACSKETESQRTAGGNARPQQPSPAATQQGQQAKADADAPARPDARAGRDHGHEHGAEREGTPAFITDAASLKSLAPTLSPDMFQGKQKLGYIAAREIPKTLAQLPCYCHCDKGFGHKSLHSCFVDDHASHCAVCIDEAVVALRLEKQEGLKPEQVRERIIEQFSKQ